MRIATLIAALGLATSAMAQMPLPTFGNTFTTGATRGFWFQVPVNCVITGLSVPNEAAQPFQAIEVIDLGAAAPPAFPATIVGTQLFYDNSSAGGSIVPAAIPLVAGQYIGVLGVCTPTVGSTTSYNSYASVAGPFVSDVLGIPTTITRFGTQFGIGAGGNNAVWTEPGGQLSRVEVYLSGAGGGTIATNTTTGSGCGQQIASFYENFANSAALDLANTTVTWFNSGSGYTVLTGVPGTFVPPSGAAINIAPGLLDGEQLVNLSAPMPVAGGTTSTLNVCTKGYVATAAGNGIDFTPSGAELLNFPQTTWACWHDFDQTIAGSGLILFEEVGGIAYVTWNGVFSYVTASSPSTVQFQFNVASGDVTLVIGAFSTVSVDPVTVGFSTGGAGVNVPGIDISATPVITLAAPESAGLALAATSRPITGTSWGLTTSQIPPTSVLGVEVIGLSDPNIPDLAFVGAPGCGLRASLDHINAFLVTGPTHAWSFGIPANPVLVGVHVYVTSAVAAPTFNTLGFITSNGIDGGIGDL